MTNIVNELTNKFSNHHDFFIEEELIDNTIVYVIGFTTLVDVTKSKLYIQQIRSALLDIIVTTIFILLNYVSNL